MINGWQCGSCPEIQAFTTNQDLRNAVRDYMDAGGDPEAAVSVTYGHPMGSWDVSQLDDFSGVCADARFNEDIGQWDVSQGTEFLEMFLGASSFNQDLSEWDMSNADDLQWMFNHAESFNGDIRYDESTKIVVSVVLSLLLESMILTHSLFWCQSVVGT